MRTAQALRDLGFTGQLRILSAERDAPYDRPPLSKDFLRPDFPQHGLELMSSQLYSDRGIELQLGDPVVAIQASARALSTAAGEQHSFDALVIATGARARMLPQLPASRSVISLRTVSDARRLKAAIATQRRIVVVGGGFIGLEVAASARAAGCPVTVIEAMPAPLISVLGPELASWLQRRHADHGVEFRCNTTVTSARASSAGHLLELSDGSELVAELVVVGVGVTRDLGWLADAGLAVHLGLVCDEGGRTSSPGIFGAGDIVCQHVEGSCRQIQHWTAATLSARRTAEAVLAITKPPPPDDGFFWSDQYDLRIQFAGHPQLDAELEVLVGEIAEGSFAAIYKIDGKMTGAIAVNQAKEFLRLRLSLRRQTVS